MAESTSGISSRNRTETSPSRGRDATAGGVVITATSSADRYASKIGLDLARSAILGVDCAEGDIVSLASGGARHDFYVLRRRWIIEEGSSQLEVTLDHPVRGRSAR
ncbi:MAG TPA: hypothetical protein VMF90_19675 [Rhizobiaceae bacterium]|nr:hypothetical protein [Rhizobiaceae bacterium]